MTSSKWEKRAAVLLLYSFFFVLEEKNSNAVFASFLLNVCISIEYIFMERKCHPE